MIYCNITVFFTFYIVFIARIFQHNEQAIKTSQRKRKVTLFINLAIFAFISESLIQFAKGPCNENSLFYRQVLGEINRKKKHVLQHFKI